MLRVAMGAWALELEGSDLKDGISSTRATGPSCEPGSDQVQTWASSLSCHVTNLRDQELDLSNGANGQKEDAASLRVFSVCPHSFKFDGAVMQRG